ncbi:MAG TPA: 3-isopropylmalate dehydratase [Candidatus Wallbacteria bacterium]|nr:MAG: 2,3-dimethylmalate dehydratase small subunit [bacterium ADurb.Bin243]HPG57163.1 3-isopropylmalate dehydratase [Candidatus Wallbacteria bacterium]
MKERIIRGRVIILRDAENNIYNNIDTDQIYHNNFLAVTEISQMGQYALGNLKGHENFHKAVQKGDIVIAGRNFGAGSSRQQAVDCFTALGVSLILCESIGAIYKRNAINSGFPIICCEDILKLADYKTGVIKDGDIIEVNIETGDIKKKEAGDFKSIGKAVPFSNVQLDIYETGSLFSFVPPQK